MVRLNWRPTITQYITTQVQCLSMSFERNLEVIGWAGVRAHKSARRKPVAKRKIFDELMEGVNAMRKHREEKLTPKKKAGQ